MPSRSPADPLAPRVEPVVLGELTAAGEPASYESDGLAISGTFDGEAWTDRSFLETSLTDSSLDRVVLRGVSMTDCILERCQAPVLDLSASRLRRTDLLHCRFGATDLHGADIESVRVLDSRWSFVNVRGATMRDVLFERCRIDELDLGEASATRMRFSECTIGSLVLHGGTFDAVDLRGAELGGIDGVEYLRGTVISEVQLQQLAPSIAAQLGICVDPES